MDWIASAAAPALTDPSATISAAQLPAASASSAVAPPPSPGPSLVRMALVGDVSISMHVAARLEIADKNPAAPGVEPGYPFAAVVDRLRGYDLLIGNLECVLASRGRTTRKKPLKGPARAPTLLKEAGFDGVSVANNHTYDLAETGFAESLRQLEAQDLPYFGAHIVDAQRDPSRVFEVNGIKIALVGHYNREPSLGLADVARAKASADVVIVFVHWGIDYDPDPTRFQRQWGRKLIDAGADAVIGAHPHVVQPEEIYDGKLIVHSLGNFVFSGMVEPGSRTGALIELDVDRTGVRDHRYRRVRLDDRGAPSFPDDARTTPLPALDPPGPRRLRPLGEPIRFGAIR